MKISLRSARRRAATMVEYGLMLALILVIAFAAFKSLGNSTGRAAVDAKGAFQ